MTILSLPREIRRATRDDTAELSRLLTRAFTPGPLSDWLMPGLRHRSSIYRPYFDIYLTHALDHGWVDVTERLDAVAIWLSASPTLEPPIDDYDRRLARACGPWIDRFVALDEAIGSAHPKYADHHYLFFLGVEPSRQSSGLGGELLRHHHRKLDDLGVPAYLEATHPRNRKLYLKHGYEDQATVHLPNGPDIFTMWRRPR